MVETNIVITAKTAAETHDFDVAADNPVTVSASGFSGDTVDIQYSADAGGSFANAYDSAGTQIQLSVTRPQITVYGPGVFRINKGITTGSVLVSLQSEQ